MVKHQQKRKKIEKKKKIPNKEQKKRKLGDSTIKHFNDWEISKKIKNCKVCAQSFSDAVFPVQCIGDNKKPSMKDEPDHFIV